MPFLPPQLYRVEVVVEGTRLTQQQVCAQLQDVLRQVEEYEGSDPPPVGVMTADNRRTWAQSRQILAGGGSRKNGREKIQQPKDEK